MAKRKSKVETKEIEVVDFDDAVAEDGGGEEAAAGPGASRARKWNYGVTAEGVLAVTDTPATGVKGDVATGYGLLEGGPLTVAAFKEAGGTRHALRVLLRRGFITNTVGDVVYPQKLG